MGIKEKIVKAAKTSYAVSKALYLVACVLCLVFTVLAIVIPLTVKGSQTSPMELCAMFVDGALVSFFAIGILWNAEQWFREIRDEQSPFTVQLPKYLKKIGIITILASVIPSTVATAVIQSVIPDSETVFNIGIGGIICGVIFIVASIFFKYAAELQKDKDETL